MVDKFVRTAACALTLAASVIGGTGVVDAAGAAPRTREEIAMRRATRPLKAVKQQAPAMRVHAGDKPLYGVQCFAYDGPLYGWSGAVHVTATGTPEKLFSLSGVAFSGCYMEGKLFMALNDAENEEAYVTYVVVDAETGEEEASVRYTTTSPNITPYGMVYDHTTGSVFGCFYAEYSGFMFSEDAQFGYINMNNALDPVSIVGELPTRMRAMVCDAKGDIYGLSHAGDLYAINKYTAEATKTGVHFDLPSHDDSTEAYYSYGHESMCCDWETGDFYLSFSDASWDSYVARLDPATGEAELVADYSYDYGNMEDNVITSLYFKQSGDAAKVAPVAVSDLAVTAVGTQLKAEVAFTMPAADTEGSALNADLTWHITDGNAELASGQAHSGTAVNTTVTLDGGGRRTIVVYTTLGGVDSNPVSGAAWFGADTPVINGLPTVRASGATLTVSWNEAVSVNGGNLDPVTYKVTRMPDNVVVAPAHTTNKLTDEIKSDVKMSYSYVIEPMAGSVAGDAVTSRSLYYGKYLSLPYEENFSDEAMFLEYPVIDANGDNNIWEYSTKYGGTAIYPSNGSTADDYLLIGPFKMVAGTSYVFHMTADGHSIRERIAVYVGTDPNDATSFATALVEPTDLIPSAGQKTFDRSYEPTADGDYYFGIKACTEGGSQYIYVYDVSVRAVGGDSPAAPTGFDPVPGAGSATLTFTLPATTIGGNKLTGLTEARIYRDEVLIGTMTAADGVAPGATLSFEDKDDVTKGFHHYAVSAVNSAGEGKSVAAQLWRGADVPGRPSNLRFWEDLDTPGLMHATFNAPERGYYGGYINPDEIDYFVDYLVMGSGSGTISLGRGTEHSFQLPVSTAAQDIFAGSVYGRNAEGVVAASSNWITQVAYFGPAMSLPVHESWPAMTQKSGIWGGQSISDVSDLGDTFWDILDGSYGSVRPQDADGGFLGLSTKVDNGGKRVLSPRVTLEGTDNPTLVFYYQYSTAATEFNVEIVVDDKPVTVLRAIDLAPANAGKWHRMELPLSDYKSSKYIQLAFSGRGTVGTNFACIDNITISDLVAHDLAVTSFAAPVKTDVNSEITLTLGVRNNGSAAVAADDYKVSFYKNGSLLDELEGKAIDADGTLSFALTDVPSVTDPSSTEYYAVVEYAADQKPADNTSSKAMVRVVVPDYPTVTDLKAANTTAGVRLSWSDPDMSAVPGVSVTETFESYESFIIDNVGSWTMHDGDGCTTVIMATTLGVLDYPHIGEPMAWQVMDPGEANIFLGAWYARSGSKMIVSFQASADNARERNSDDWLISPELNGSEQVVSFYARAGMGGAYAPEIFDFMISSEGNAVADFKPLASDVEVPYTSDSWTEYSYRLPAGTRYFAIVHKSFNKLAMLVDDITYIPAGSTPVQLDLQGFNVYRDGKRLNSEPLPDNEYVDATSEEGHDYAYNVTAVWDKGEAALSNTVTIKASTALDAVGASALRVSGMQGFIRIDGGEGEAVAVYTPSGVCVAMVEARGRVDVAVPAAGVYLVKAGAAVAKVAVR